MTRSNHQKTQNFSAVSVAHAVNDMLKMQNTLNVMTNGSNWRSGLTQAGKVINWQRCIYMETAELIDSYPWKHWKAIDAKADMENARVELVDIWHFLLSLVLEHHSEEEAKELLMNAYLQQQATIASVHDNSVMEQIKVFEELMRQALQQETQLLPLAVTFFQACEVAELSFNHLYEIYMAKNVLNKFRQDHGYKEGTYIKDWNGKEDNVVMFEVIAESSHFDSDLLYNALKERYLKI